MEFRCGALNSTEYKYFPCQHGGPCVLDAVRGEVCAVCDDGWMHDFFGFGHFYNCATPTWAPLVLCIVHAAILTLGLGMVAVLFYRGEIKPGKTRTVTFINVSCAILGWLSILCVYIQNGLYEGSLVCLMLLGSLGYCISPFIVPNLLRPIASITHHMQLFKWVTLVFRSVSACLVLVHIVLVALAIAYCRDENKAFFNRLTLIAMYTVVGVVFIQAVFTILVSYRIWRFFSEFGQRTLSSNNNAGNAEKHSAGSGSPFAGMGSFAEQRHRLIVSQLFVIGVFCMIVLGSAILIIIPLVLWTVYHSLPFLWLFHILAFPLVALTFPLLIPFVRGAAAGRFQRMISSSGDRHFISEGADVVELDGSAPQIRGLGLKKKRKNPPWRVRIGHILSKISEEQSASQVDSKMRTIVSKTEVASVAGDAGPIASQTIPENDSSGS